MDDVTFYIDELIDWASRTSHPMQSHWVMTYMAMLSGEVDDRKIEIPANDVSRLRQALEACAAIVHAPGYHSSENYWMQFLRIGRGRYPDRAKHWWWWVILPNAK